MDYKKYLIKDNDQFNPEQFPFIVEETAIIKAETANVPLHFKGEIIVSFLKNHSLKTEWLQENPELTALLASGSLTTDKFESLFDSCNHNLLFREAMEEFLRKKFSE